MLLGLIICTEHSLSHNNHASGGIKLNAVVKISTAISEAITWLADRSNGSANPTDHSVYVFVCNVGVLSLNAYTDRVGFW